MDDHKVAIDSNALTYLVDAMYEGTEPKCKIASEKVSLLRIYLYRNDILYMPPTVKAEYKRIRDDQHKKKHDQVSIVLIGDIFCPDSSFITSRSDEYSAYHTGDKNRNDCQILAEAELGGCKYLLTYDNDFIYNLKDKTHSIELVKPSEFWQSLDIKKGVKPNTSPHQTNPLSNQSWWRW